MRRRDLLVGAIALGATTPAYAQSNGTTQGESRSVADSGFSTSAPQAHLSLEEAVAFAKQIEDDLPAKQARLAMVLAQECYVLQRTALSPAPP